MKFLNEKEVGYAKFGVGIIRFVKVLYKGLF